MQPKNIANLMNAIANALGHACSVPEHIAETITHVEPMHLMMQAYALEGRRNNPDTPWAWGLKGWEPVYGNSGWEWTSDGWTISNNHLDNEDATLTGFRHLTMSHRMRILATVANKYGHNEGIAMEIWAGTEPDPTRAVHIVVMTEYGKMILSSIRVDRDLIHGREDRLDLLARIDRDTDGLLLQLLNEAQDDDARYVADVIGDLHQEYREYRARLAEDELTYVDVNGRIFAINLERENGNNDEWFAHIAELLPVVDESGRQQEREIDVPKVIFATPHEARENAHGAIVQFVADEEGKLYDSPMSDE